MLKITLVESAGAVRLGLEGSLSGPWAGELRRCWKDAVSAASSRKTVVDLREVDFVDGEGECALAEMHRAGARLVAATPVIQALIRKISRAARCGTVEEQPAIGADVSVCPDTPGRDPRSL
jgi:anti-anti-sigma regulatory factor